MTPIRWYPCPCGADHDTPTCPFGAGELSGGDASAALSQYFARRQRQQREAVMADDHFEDWASHIVDGIETKAPSQIEWEIVEALQKAHRLASSWQPIETAPKDGTEVLVWDGFNLMVSAWFAFSEALGEWNSRAPCAEEPTHWMPLQAPPVSDQGDGAETGE